MEARTFLLATVAFLGFLSGLLGFIAEGKKVMESNITRLSASECVHSRSPALVLGLVAAIALLIAQIISNSLGGCICCESRLNDPSGKNTPTVLAITFLTLSWITFSIAFLLLIAGASINDRRDTLIDNLSSACFILKSGVFTGAAFASFTTAILGIAYNVQVFSIRKTVDSTSIGSVGPGSSEAATINHNQGALASQGYSIGKPIFSSEQQIKTALALDTEVQKSAYARSAVNNNDFRSLQMVNVTTSAGKPIQYATKTSDPQGSREPQIGNTEI